MAAIEDLYRQLIDGIGEDPNREGLKGTPRRAAEALRFMTRGYTEDLDKLVNHALFEADTQEMVLVKNIELYSLCEHHLMPFLGKCHVAYIPSRKVLGVSKVARIVDTFARRLQIQEKLTKQIAETVQKYTQAQGVAVVIEAQHLCMMMRGVEKQNSVMTTSCVLGEFHEDASTRAEFFSLIGK
ncbi:MAG TPA: GTP cyclohydrolase I FolE [Candidatus Deferrimicrobium sp.]|nr:GTP cyclohydrolase I FolE [Candidatus Deferrimicrobium sp.]